MLYYLSNKIHLQYSLNNIQLDVMFWMNKKKIKNLDFIVQNHLNYEYVPLLQVNAIMAEVDVDHNGKMDLAEFIVMMHNQVFLSFSVIFGYFFYHLR